MPEWTTRSEVVARLRRRWESGALLGAYSRGDDLLPLGVPLRAPAARDLGANFAAAQEWTQRWSNPDKSLRIEFASVGGRLVGANEIPKRAWVDSWDQLWSLLGVTEQVRAFTAVLDRTHSVAPELVGWMQSHPHDVLTRIAEWPLLLSTVHWIADEAEPGDYLRYLDLPGVDTKFVEQHQRILARLLDLVLPAERIDSAFPPSDFVGRYRFRRKPRYSRFRRLDPCHIGAGFSELTVRTDELAANPPRAANILVVENETTYLALPQLPDTLAVFGEGYAVSRLAGLSWLADRHLYYWGDIDTHGFAILNQLREPFPHLESILMDRQTLLSHESRWVREPSPAFGAFANLNSVEGALYRDLVEQTFGDNVRLEQERIRFSAVTTALARIASRRG
ncbi:Wadjet anti-phage system protein JetD domain-containing protein [Nocardia sp. BMG111209]|uniref:Wadjet anti-phage system protein JetD domain-containing protein n=1 Tax=Nocardia sp. BMG111209 TaxID=1160137 RepID=UPI0003742D89|nr:Wadjet anti-phage system protein JetD domain-containing protein [Nocardia sp. BMG111209]